LDAPHATGIGCGLFPSSNILQNRMPADRRSDQGVGGVSSSMLTQLNVWIDVVFTTLYAVIVVALAIHFLGNVLTGRAKKRFVGWEWPHHEGGPIPAAPKIMHFQHVAAMIALAISGMYIRFPFFDGGRWAMRWVHYVAMTIVIINLIVRLWYAFASKRRDYKEFAVNLRDITTAPMVIAYYIFLIPPEKKPHVGKYNVMQKGTYLMFVPLLILQAITGLALLTYTIPFTGSITSFGHAGVTMRDLILGWNLGAMLGSIDLAGWWARTAHYLINWLFIVLTTIHVYLSVTEDFPAFMDFFGLSGAEHHDGDPHDLAHTPEESPALAGTEHA
jgi:Ni,Fe-hydrogenase I cytochrome b subunit